MVQTLATLALIIVTGVYVWVTWRIASASKKQAEASNRQADVAEQQLEQVRQDLEAHRDATDAQLAQMRVDPRRGRRSPAKPMLTLRAC